MNTNNAYGTTTIAKQIGIWRTYQSVVGEAVVDAVVTFFMTTLAKKGRSRQQRRRRYAAPLELSGR
jgi:hypothetical protein